MNSRCIKGHHLHTQLPSEFHWPMTFMTIYGAMIDPIHNGYIIHVFNTHTDTDTRTHRQMPGNCCTVIGFRNVDHLTNKGRETPMIGDVATSDRSRFSCFDWWWPLDMQTSPKWCDCPHRWPPQWNVEKRERERERERALRGRRRCITEKSSHSLSLYLYLSFSLFGYTHTYLYIYLYASWEICPASSLSLLSSLFCVLFSSSGCCHVWIDKCLSGRLSPIIVSIVL